VERNRKVLRAGTAGSIQAHDFRSNSLRGQCRNELADALNWSAAARIDGMNNV